MRNLFFILCCFLVSSCTTVPAIYTLLDFVELTPAEAADSQRTVQLRNAAQIEFSNQRTPLPPVRMDGEDLFAKWTEGEEYRVGTISAGTSVKVLALVFSEGTEEYPYIISDRVRYLVELPDGQRGTAHIPEVAEGMKVMLKATGEEMTIARVRIENVPAEGFNKAYKKYYYKMEENGEEYRLADLDCRNKRHLPVYRDGTIVFLDDVRLNSISGMTLQQLEAHIAPTFNISRQNGKLVAHFPFINYTTGDDYYSHLEVTLARQDTLIVAESYALANLQHPSEYSWLTRTFFDIQNFTYKTTIKKDASHFAYYAFPRFNAWNSYYLNSIARIALGVAVGFFFFAIFFIYILPKLAHSIFYIRRLTNPQVKWISVLLYLIVMSLAVVYFGLYDPISLIFVLLIFMVMYGVLYNELDLTRCEVCHRVGTIEQTDHVVLNEGTTTDGQVHHGSKRVQVGVKVTTTTYRTRYGGSHSVEHREPIYRDVRYSFVRFFYHKKWKDFYKCTNCGQRIVYNRSRHSTYTQVVG